jgi:hypothetical protein
MELTHSQIIYRFNKARERLEGLGFQIQTVSEIFSVTAGADRERMFWINCNTVDSLESVADAMESVSNGKAPFKIKERKGE